MTSSSSDRKLKFAVFGVGRMGARHARNVAFFTPRAELVAIVDPNPTVLESAKEWAPKNVKFYTHVEDALKDPDVEAVLIASVTASHAPNAIAAIEAGKHVLVEKPLSIDLETSRKVVEVAEAHPELKVMVGFSRRFDESYREVKKLAEEGALGNVHMIRSATNDQYDPTGFFVAYSKFSGGIWIDCGIHDIDIARWIFDASNPAGLENPKKQVTRVYAIGQNVRHPELVKDGDADNALAVVEFASGKILHFHCSRTTIHGHDCVAEVFGTEGRAVVNSNPSLTRTELRDAHGVRTLSTPTYYERFKQAFVTEVNEFTAAVLDDKPLPVVAKDALEASKIAAALTESFRRNKPILFDEEGEAILD